MNDPASTVPAARDAGPLGELEELRRRFPSWLITLQPDRFNRDWRYIAVAANLSVTPSCVITDDPAELAAALSGGAR